MNITECTNDTNVFIIKSWLTFSEWNEVFSTAKLVICYNYFTFTIHSSQAHGTEYHSIKGKVKFYKINLAHFKMENKLTSLVKEIEVKIQGDILNS